MPKEELMIRAVVGNIGKKDSCSRQVVVEIASNKNTVVFCEKHRKILSTLLILILL
jgi:hypothetical protein